MSKEEALKISAGDPITIRRKWKSVAWEVDLPMKLFLLTNTIPVLNDSTDLAKRVTTASNLSKVNIEGLSTKLFRAHGDDRVWLALG